MNKKPIILIPIIFALILSIVLTIFLVSFENQIFIEQSNKIKNTMVSEQKSSIKNNINNIINILNQKSESFINLQKNILKMRTSHALHIINNIYKKNRNLSEAKLFAKIKECLDFISTIDKSKYFYIYKMDGTCISVPANRKLEGKNLINLQDIKGQYVIQDMINIAKKGGGFNQWYYLNPKTHKIEKKIGYAMFYKPLNIFIGTAIYEQDIINNIKQFSSKLLNNFKTTKGGYIFAYDYKANTIAHIKKDLIGKNRWNEKVNGKFLVQEGIKTGQQKGGGFLTYNATINPNTKQSTHKISYINEFKKLQWVIGTGFYTDKVYHEIKISQDKLKSEFDKKLQNIIISTILFTLLLIIILWLIFNKLSNKIIDYKIKLENNNKELNDLNINLENKVKEKTKIIIQENRLKELYINTINTIIVVLDKDGNITLINKTGCKTLGFNYEDIIGKNWFEIGVIPKDLLIDIKDYFYQIIEGNIQLDKLYHENKLVTSKGEKLLFSWFNSILEVDGEIVGIISSGIDITNEKRQEEIINQQSKLASMGEMIGNIAHQWRQPLSVISTAASGMKMQQEYNVLKEEDIPKMCDAINDNAQYLSKTIDDFRNFIKGDRTQKIFNLKKGIDSFLNLVDGSAKNNNINIILDLQEDIQIDGYENELIQCLINIFNNSKDALKENMSKNEDRFVFITTSTNEDKAIIKIKDNAGGIPEDIINRVFEPYFTTKHKSQGTGLGLHMSYNLIVDGMDGTVEATNVNYSYENKNYTGAEFTIILPVS